MIITIQVIANPEKAWKCDGCGDIFCGVKIRLFGRVSKGAPVQTSYLCINCSKHVDDPKMNSVFEKYKYLFNQGSRKIKESVT